MAPHLAASGPVALMHILVIDNADNSGLGFIERQLVNLMLALIHAPAFHKVIAIGGNAALKAFILHKLPQGSFGTDGGFFAFAVLPFLVNNRPAHFLTKGVAGFPLHGNVGLVFIVVIHLLIGRHTVA